MVQEKTVTIICGPTAVGKTAYAVELAKKGNAEIISADSGPIYRGLDIGTAKPTVEERQEVVFHLLDIIDPSQRFNAADFRNLALQKIGEIQARGKRVLVVGGTGLYVKVLEEGIFTGPSADPGIRARLEERCRAGGVELLHQELQKIDPVAAEKIPVKNRQRIIRALEVYEITGRPISEFWKISRTRLTGLAKLGLTLSRETLNRRINARVDQMISRGWVEETATLLSRWGAEAPGLQIIGYKELVSHLQGKISRAEAIEQIKLHTRQYAKRQMTWFKRDSEICWKPPNFLTT